LPRIAELVEEQTKGRYLMGWKVFCFIWRAKIRGGHKEISTSGGEKKKRTCFHEGGPSAWGKRILAGPGGQSLGGKGGDDGKSLYTKRS